MLLKASDKVLIAHRRLFEEDQPRYFAGEVIAYDEGLVKARGYTFVRDPMSGNVLRKSDPRTKIVSLASGYFLAYELPRETDIDQLSFQIVERQITLCDNSGVSLNMSEIPSQGVI
jgi:hypothetical protein